MIALLMTLAFAQDMPSSWIQSKHGFKMMVTYQPSTSGPSLLVVSEQDQITNAAKEKQRIDLGLRGQELLSNHNGFDCVDASGDRVYAVVAPSNAKEKGKFNPVRAWAIDQQNAVLNPIKDPKAISCEWSPEGDNKFPFGKKK